jgi:vacuolar-type H+-ATPase subunit I/STV1
MADMSEHMEAFFGVNLEDKYIDTLKDLDEAVDDIKDISSSLRELAKEDINKEIRKSLNENRNILFEIAQQIRDRKSFLEFYFRKENGVRHIVQERDTYMKLFQIMKWDTIDVRDLKRWLEELRTLCDNIGLRAEDLINFKRLDTQPIPEDIASYPVLVKDKHGYCLTGEKWDVVIHEDEVRDEMGISY